MLRSIRYGRLGIAVVLGVVTSVGVAWGFYMWQKRPLGGLDAVWMKEESRGVVILAGQTVGRRSLALGQYDFEPGSNKQRLWHGKLIAEIDYPQAMGIAPEIVDVFPELQSIFVESAGFPMLCVFWRVDHITHMPNRTWGRLRYRQYDSLPASPLWGRLAVNTAFYGAAWYPLLGVPGMVMARMRKRRGMCRGCGYDMRGLAVATCPECGKG